MSSIDPFIDDMVRDLRQRLALLGDGPEDRGGERRAIEDGIALLTDYRLSGMDEPLFERLIASLRGGRSPVSLSVLRPEVIARELSQRWATHTSGAAAQALT